MTHTVGSLFAGIGGFDLGLRMAGGFRTVWLAEQNAYRRKVLARHFPDARIFRDVRHVHPHTAEPVTVITGGFPCQDASDAGTRTGTAGGRTGLWVECARAVDQFRPAWAIFENVEALRRRGLASVLRDLAALGYDAEWDCIPAASVGAPHERDRLWIVAYPALSDADEDRRDDDRDPQGGHEGQALAGVGASGERRGAGPERSGSDARRALAEDRRRSAADAAGPLERQGAGERDAGPRVFGAWWRDAARELGRWPAEPDVDRVADGVPSRVDRVAALGDSLVPQIPMLIGRAINEWEAR